MKNILNKALVALITLTAGPQLQAWTYEFSNHTPHTIAVSMRYRGINEPREFRVIAPNEMKRFRPGDPGISEWKRGFVVDRFDYIKNPTSPITDANKENVPWRGFQVTFIPSESYKYALELAESVGTTSEAIGTVTAKAIGAYMTAGASVAAEAAAKAAKAAVAAANAKDATAANKAANDAIIAAEGATKAAAKSRAAANDALAKAKAAKAAEKALAEKVAADAEAKATQAESDAAAAKAAAANAKGAAASTVGGGSFGLAGLLKSIGQVAARSMAASRHMDIVEDEDGKITFISLL